MFLSLRFIMFSLLLVYLYLLAWYGSDRSDFLDVRNF